MLKKIAFIFLMQTAALFCTFTQDVRSQIFYQSYKGNLEKALKAYQKELQLTHSHDYELLQTLCQNHLSHGAKSSDEPTALMALFGAGISQHPQLLSVLEEGLRYPSMKHQLAALNFLSKFESDEAHSLMLEALSSPFLITRLEGCYQLSNKQETKVVDHLSSLYHKVPPPVHALFPQILINLDTQQSNQLLRQFLADKEALVRAATLLQVAKERRDDFLPQVRSLSTQTHFAQLEATLYALGRLSDQHSRDLIFRHTTSKQDPIRIAALTALISLGEQEAFPLLLEEAKKGDLFAITFLGTLKDQESLTLLQKLCASSDENIQLNAAIALLKRQQLPSLSLIKRYLLTDETASFFIPISTPAGTHQAWKAASFPLQNKESAALAKNASLQCRVSMLSATRELDEKTFLEIARALFEEKKRPLIPLLVDLIVNHPSEEGRLLLKEMAQKVGAPWIRTCSLLALYRLNEPGPYEEQLIDWVKGERKHQIISFEEKRLEERGSAFELTPDETSQLYLAVLDALAQAQSVKGIEALIDIMHNGNSLNSYALAGILIRITE